VNHLQQFSLVAVNDNNVCSTALLVFITKKPRTLKQHGPQFGEIIGRIGKNTIISSEEIALNDFEVTCGHWQCAACWAINKFL